LANGDVTPELVEDVVRISAGVSSVGEGEPRFNKKT
jgi:hypothetical protein